MRRTVASTVLQFIRSGNTEFTILDVAGRSGIARSTIHARWPTREALIAEALSAHHSTFQVKARADWRAHLLALARKFRDFSARPAEIAISGLTAFLGPGFLHEETHRQWDRISMEMAQPLLAAQQKGEIRSNVEVRMVIATLFTTIAGLIVIAKDIPSDGYLEQLVDLLIAGAESRTRDGGQGAGKRRKARPASPALKV